MKALKLMFWITFILSLAVMLVILWEGLTSGSWRGKILVSIGFAFYVVAWILIWWRGGIRKEKSKE